MRLIPSEIGANLGRLLVADLAIRIFINPFMGFLKARLGAVDAMALEPLS
jgi:hypothetical protein